MRWNDPNRPEQLNDPRPEAKYLSDDTATGKVGDDGYTVVARRPRVKGMTEPVEVDRADRIEQPFVAYDD